MKKNPRAYISRVELLARNPVLKALAGQRCMKPSGQLDLSLAARIAFESASRGTCNDADRDTLAGTVNVCMVLAENHCAPHDLDACLSAQEAMLRADVRVAEGKHWAFDGPGRVAYLVLLDIHEQLIAQLGQHALTKAVLEVIKRRRSGQVHPGVACANTGGFV